MTVESSRVPDRHALRRDAGCWTLLFEGRSAVLIHEIGLLHISWLLRCPGEPLHGLDLALRSRMVSGGARADAAVDLEMVKTLLAAGRGSPHQALLLVRRRRELRAIIEDENETEPVKNEAREEFEAISGPHERQIEDGAGKAVRAVRRAPGPLPPRSLESLHRRGRPPRPRPNRPGRPLPLRSPAQHPLDRAVAYPP